MSKSRPISLLLIEDNPLDADLVLARLKKGGIEIDRLEQVDHAQAAQRAIECERYDLILSDYQLPDFTGEVALELAKTKCPTTPFIVVSGAMGEDIAVDMLQKGATDFVTKGRLDRLVPAVKRALNEAAIDAKRRAAETELERRSAVIKAITDNAPSALFLLDPNGCITFLNPAAEALLGVTAADAIGKNHHETFHKFYPDGAPFPADECPVVKAFQSGTSVRNIEHVYFKKDGTPLPAECSMTPIIEFQQVRGAVLELRDISAKKAAEEALARKVNELASANEILTKTNIEMERFAYVSSHDLQEPLRKIASYAQLLAERYRGQLDASADRYIEILSDSVMRMHTLIKDLLAYSRLGQQDSSLQPVDLNAVVGQIMDDLEPLISSKKARLKAGKLPTVQASASQMYQLMQNLIANAIKFQKDAAPEIKVGAHRENGGWVIEVQDNGIGIDADHQEQIFQVFQRLHPRHHYPGTGIGLAICKKIVEQHGGRIWVESAPGKGSKFLFYLPSPSRS